MAGFGEQLRMERERRGLSLETLCVETKVQQRHFEALEEEDYRALPGGVFRRGIVRAYLAATGLEEQVWMPRFQESYEEKARAMGENPEPDGEEAWANFAENVRKNRIGSGSRNGARWLGVLGLLLVLLTAAWAVWHFLLRVHVTVGGHG
jgi:cytoskeleton protein RodZ